MKQLQLTRPSPAMVLAAIALILAMAGTAIAGPSAISSKITKSKVKQISKKQINKAAPGLSVNNADNLGGAPAAAYLKGTDVRADGNASSDPIDDFTTPDFTSILDKSFNAPRDGFAFVTATLSTEDDSSFPGGGDLLYRLALDGVPLEADEFAHEINTNEDVDIFGGSGAITEVVPISAGPHTVSLQAEEIGSGDFIEGREISILSSTPTGSAATIPHKAGAVSGGANRTR
jgi:hypothetical protein